MLTIWSISVYFMVKSLNSAVSLNTGNKIIVECSPYDAIWGNGLNITDTLNTPSENWKGTNRLGKAIMKVRNVLS